MTGNRAHCAICRERGHDRRKCHRKHECICKYDPRSPVRHQDGCPLQEDQG
jgi:hypothetical protein